MKLQGVIGVLAIAAVACGSKKSEDPLVYAGAFQIPVPEDWHNVTTSDFEPGAVALQTLKIGDRKNKPAVTVVFTPLPEPIAKDPADPATCKAHAETLTLVVESSSVIDLPIGKACAVEATKDTTLRASQVVLKVGEHGLMANCSHRGGAEEKKLCDAMFKRIAVKK